MGGLRRGPGKVDGAAPRCGSEQQFALDGSGILGRVGAWRLGCVEKDVAAMGGSSSRELRVGAGRNVGAGRERSPTEHATSQVAGAGTNEPYIHVWEVHHHDKSKGNAGPECSESYI